jgi:heme/copper-type cytochrome/quinol oxidase subunit 1
MKNLNTLVAYSQSSIRSDKGSYFDSTRFRVFNISKSYIDLIDRFREFKKIYSQNIDKMGRFNLKPTLVISFSSYLFTKYDSIVRGRAWYFMNSWVYTTNHKRIAVNYFWFVIFAGICGMSLATIIRLEMAYPGVGILAGDSLQYLSVVTAHAVVMVFFMIMPLMFGAFGNFLLPTQLGVHDVAFPRLNSAAFWFLPGGLIMLCQLLCLDRRYQRMNCFNVRELQALLKNRFFTELVNSTDHREFLDQTAIGLRFKTNDLDSINSNILLLFRYGLNVQSQARSQEYTINNNIIFGDSEKETSFNKTGYVWQTITELEDFVNNKFISPILNSLLTLNNAVTDNIALKPQMVTGFFTFADSATSAFSLVKGTLEKTSILTSHFFTLTESVGKFFTHYIKLVVDFFSKSLTSMQEDNLDLEEVKILLSYLFGINRIKLDESKSNESRSIYSEVFNAYDFFMHNYNVEDVSTFIEASLTNQVTSTPWLIRKYVINTNLYELTLVMITNSLTLLVDSLYITIMNLFRFVREFDVLTLNPLSTLNLIVMNVRNSLELCSDISMFLGGGSSSFLYVWWQSKLNLTKPETVSGLNGNESLFFASTTNEVESFVENRLSSLEESSHFYRFQKHQSPIFKPDFKAGNFFTRDDFVRRASLLTTISDLTKGMRRPVWFLSDIYQSSLKSLTDNYFNLFTMSSNPSTGDSRVGSTFMQNPYGFFNVFYLLNTSRVFDEEINAGVSKEQPFLNQRWLGIQMLNQKFYRMQNTMSMQQRTVSNWRQLKFTREGWRCRLLAARHQKTLFRRYVREDGMLWSFERNAKDVLPGWAMITPFSARTRFTAIGKVDIGLMGVFLVLNSSIVSSANFLVTYRYLSTLNNRKMRDARSFFTEGVMVASWMMIAANPMLAIGILMLLSDRHWQTSFFDYSGGGDTVLFQHMFWFFGHPEVYVIMIPAFGFTNTILSYYLRKRVSARASLLYSMYTIAFLGFFVWGHHMYMVGLAHTTRMLFSTLTVMISVPAATKLMHWCVTLVNSTICMELPLLFTLLFIFFFVSGGISGMAVAHTGMDILFHDSFYVVGHFHVMFAGSAMFASFGAFYFYFPAIFGCKYSRIWGYLHCVYYLLGQLMTVVPMFWLGYGGMPRRVLDYPAALGGWHAITSAGHLLSVAGMLAFFIMIFDSHRQFRAATLSTLGVSRFSVRLSFYIYEISRVRRLMARWGLNISSFNFSNSVQLNQLNFSNKEPLESTLYSYTFVQNKSTADISNSLNQSQFELNESYLAKHYTTPVGTTDK